MSATIWSSAQLVYRSPEESDHLFLAYMSQDALSFTQSAPFLPIPQGETSGKGSREWISNQLLGVLVCLPLPDGSRSYDPTVPDEPVLDKDGNEKPRPKPRPIGFITLQAGDPKQAHHRQAEIGVTLAKGFQGKGYGREAIEWSLHWGFKFAGLHRIGIGAFEYNPRALALYRRIGFKDEGVKRECLWFDGRYWDIIDMGMLEDEWRELQAQKERKVVSR